MTPDEHTNYEFFLDASDGHQLYVHDWGKKDAMVPIIFLHGGPGAGVSDRHKQRFVPEQQRIIFFDQRGAGKSLPVGSLDDNTTEKLIGDIEAIRNKLNIEKFIVVGGSWGSTLALVYGLKHPGHVHAMVLNGIFTARKSEIEYLDSGGFRTFFPDLWDKYQASVPQHYRKNPSKYHYKNIFGKDENAAKNSAYAYSEKLEGPLLGIDDRYSPDKYEEFDPNPMKIELHYLANACFLPENYILDNAHKLTMPIWLVQGRYDMVCPPITAYELHKKLPNSQLIWTIAGHGNDRANYDVNRTILLQMTQDS